MRPLLPLLMVASLMAAGCSDDPVTGTVEATSHTLSVTGTAQVFYQAFSPGGNPVGTPPGQCAQDAVNGSAPLPPGSPVQPCKPALTRVSGSFTGLPEPGTQLYSVYLAGGQGGELKVDDLAPAGGADSFNATFPANHDGKFLRLELRLSGFVVASAPATAGAQAFAPAAPPPTVQARFSGHELTADVSGLPGNGTYVGWLYAAGPDGLPVREESFPVTAGENRHAAKRPVSGFVELHIHVADSMANIYKGTIKADAE